MSAMPAPTPSPLRRMALGASVPKVSKPRLRSDIEAMPPPAPPATRRSQLGRKRVLEEDDYVEAIDAIIERDFFPNLPGLQRRLRWLQLHGAGATATATSDSAAATPTNLWQSSGSSGGGSNRGTLAAQLATPVSEWGDDSEPSATPLRGGASAAGGGGSSTAAAADVGAAPGAGAAATALSLTDFVRHNVSEDHESFQEVLEADQERHRRKFFWAFDGGVGSGAGGGGNAAPQLMLLKDGTAMTTERRALADAACEPEAMLGDSRPGVLDTWKHRVRNPFMFGADMAISREICGVSGAAPLLLTDADGSSGNGGSKGRTGIGADGGGKVIQHHATRFPPPEATRLTPGGSSSGASSVFGGFEAPNSERSSVAGLEGLLEGSAARRKERNDVPVAMTPSPMPGIAGDSPMITWGDIVGTPLVLDPTKTPLPGVGPGGDDGYGGYGGGYAGDGSGASRFRINEQPRREALAHGLDAATRKKRKTGGAAATAAAAGATPLTPAARAFAARLAKTRQPGGQTPFGGALSTPKRAAAAAGGSSAAWARGISATPLLSPGPLARGSTPVAGAKAANGTKASRITDGLLKL